MFLIILNSDQTSKIKFFYSLQLLLLKLKHGKINQINRYFNKVFHFMIFFLSKLLIIKLTISWLTIIDRSTICLLL